MSTPTKIDTLTRSHFAAYALDGVTAREGAAGDFSTILLRNAALAGEAVAIAEIGDGQYVASFTPTALGTYTLVLHDSLTETDSVETFSVSENDIDDVVAAVNAITAHDALVSVTNIESLRAGAVWAPNLVFLRRSTMTPVDPDSIDTLVILEGDGSTEVEEIDGGDLTREELGRYSAEPEQLASAGNYFLRVTFTYSGVEIVDILRIYAAPARGEASGGAGSTTDLARVYTYPASLTAARFNLSDYTAAEVWRRIRDVSAQIEALTKGNIFNGEYGDYLCSGRSRRTVYHPMQLPFVYVESIHLSADRTDHLRDGIFRTPYSSYADPEVASTNWALRGGLIESIKYDFPMGSGNVTVTGAVGKLEPSKFVSTLSASVVGSDSDSVEVEDSAGFAPRDVVDLIGEDNAARVILTSVDRTTHTLYFDALGGDFESIPVGATVRSFGAVPRPVEQVANYLFGVLLREEAANADGVEHIPAGRIRREKTDDYEIEFQIADASATLTGSVRYDLLLLPYMKAIDVRIP